MTSSRPGSITSAAVLLGLVSLTGSTVFVVAGPPLPVKVIVVIASLIGLIATYGLWNAKRWGMILAVIISTVNALTAAPGLIERPNPTATIIAGVVLVLSVLIIVLALLPPARKAYA